MKFKLPRGYLKDFSEPMSPLSLLLSHIFIIAAVVLIFEPTLAQMLGLLLFDMCLGLIATGIDRKVFTTLFPHAQLFSPQFNIEKLKRLSPDEQLQTVSALLRYPTERTRYLLIAHALKVLPAGLIIMLSWNSFHSPVIRGGIYAIIQVFQFTFFYGTFALENHSLASRTLKRIHDELDWEKAFDEVKLDSRPVDCERQELTAHLGIGLFVLLLGLSTHYAGRPYWIQSFILLYGITFALRIWLLGRHYTGARLQNVLEHLGNLELGKPIPHLALSTAPRLAHFEKTFNLLRSRVQSSEEELSHWIFDIADQQRMSTLGEISALMLHDMNQPLHVLQFCLAEIKEEPLKLKQPRFEEQVDRNMQKLIQLSDSLRYYLKGTSSAQTGTSVSITHRHVTEILQAQFSVAQLKNIRFEWDPHLDRIALDLSGPDLSHILENLYRNAIQAILDSKRSDGLIRVKLLDLSREFATLTIEDNGTGLTPIEFAELTEKPANYFYEEQRKQGLGLRLICRLARRVGGSLEAHRPENPNLSTRLTLKLRCLPLKPHQESPRAGKLLTTHQSDSHGLN